MTTTRNRPSGRLVVAKGGRLLPGVPPRRVATARGPTPGVVDDGPTDDPPPVIANWRRPVLALSAIAAALVLGLVACTIGAGLSVIDDTPDTPEVRVLWFLSWAFPDVGDKGPWQRNVCDDATGRVSAVIQAEDQRLHDEFAPDWIARHAWNPDYRSTESGHHASVAVDGELEIHRAGENGFNPYTQPDRTWTFTLRHNPLHEWVWCITHVRSRPT
ncbi:hypothetical protein [Cryptosporangium sp. NPDC051539]|uniref:hypothetical protein n=1 Tax=Cryptosporangium sp. NPDC051539 TaxID=3363962 RepID=UPI00379A770E